MGADLIRPVRLTDAEALVRIYSPIVLGTAISFEFEPPDEAEFMARIEQVTATDPWLVHERDGRVVGYAYGSDFRSRPAYATTRETTVYVDPGHHRTGVARSLMVELLDRLDERGAHLAVAAIVLPNDGSIRLHESLGYRPVGVIDEIARKFDTWQRLGLWQCRLADRRWRHPAGQSI